MNEILKDCLPDKPSISDHRLGRICDGMFYSLKKLSIQPQNRNSDSVKQERIVYANWFLSNLVDKKCVYIDESGINLWTHRTRGRSKIGTLAVRQVNFHRGKNVTLLLAISETDGVIESKFNLGGTKSADFHV